MSFLSIDEYTLAEREGSKLLPARAIQAFSPATFAALNYPTRVLSENEIFKFIDTMH